MFHIYQDSIGDLAGVTECKRARQYFQEGRVGKLEHKSHNNYSIIEAEVSGTCDYRTHLRLKGTNLAYVGCDCFRFMETSMCKHVLALILTVQALHQSNVSMKTDPIMARILQEYLVQPNRDPQLSQQVSLFPTLDLPTYYRDITPAIRLQIGGKKRYVIKDAEAFVRQLREEATVCYGKDLTLCHKRENFDPAYHKLLDLVIDIVDTQKYYMKELYWSGKNRGELPLSGHFFNAFFDLYCGQVLPCKNGQEIAFVGENPEITLRLSPESDGAILSMEQEGRLIPYRWGGQSYVLMQDTLHRCSHEFGASTFPLLADLKEQLFVAQEDMPTLAGCVLETVSPFVSLQDDGNLMEEYLPQSCETAFYLDSGRNKPLCVDVVFSYGDNRVKLGTSTSETPEIRRNLAWEQGIVQLFPDYMVEDEGRFNLALDQDLPLFFLDILPLLREKGQVYLSDRLEKRQISTTQPSVSISLTDGLLQMDMNLGDFPPEELTALYESLLQKRRFHQLADGRFLPLDGSAYETLGEMTQMLQMTPKQLATGSVSVPAFRALYLDQVLQQHQGIHTGRDRNYKQLLRQFQTIAQSDYALPTGLALPLRSYQEVGYQWLKTMGAYQFCGILADEMGLGKTAQIIAYLLSNVEDGESLPSLIVCPASLLFNWLEEFVKFAPSLRVLSISGTATVRRELWETVPQYHVAVTTYDLLKRDREQLSDISFHSCVLDEGQFIKNHTTLASQAVKQVVCRQRFVMTGTPIENRLSELWNLFDFLMPGYLYTQTRFRDKMEKPILKAENQQAMTGLRRMVKPFLLRRKKADVLQDLPPKIQHIRKIGLSDSEKKVYDATLLATRESILGGKNKLQILAALTKLRQICCDPSLVFENYEGDCSKLEACLELTQSMVENDHQILIFSQFTSMLQRIARGLDKLGISSFTLQGSTPRDKRSQLVKDFTKGKASVFLISLKAGGTGLNLTSADVVIHYDPWWNMAAQDQATDRAHRIGQNAHVHVYKLLAKDTLEERILALQEKKAQLLEQVSADSQNGLLSMDSSELLQLLTDNRESAQ